MHQSNPSLENGAKFNIKRRELLKFLGALGGAAIWHGMSAGPVGRAFASTAAVVTGAGRQISPFKPLPGLGDDDLVLAAGASADILLKYGDPINERGDWFGFANDFIAFLPLVGGRVITGPSQRAPVIGFTRSRIMRRLPARATASSAAPTVAE